MTPEEYNIEQKALEQEFNKKKSDLVRKFALANNLYNIGDIIQDHINMIKIERITVSTDYSTNIPTCIYHGIKLKKDGEPTKKEQRESIWQSNIKK